MDIQLRMTSSAAPVQFEGKIDGTQFYFRSRHQHWSMGIGGDDPVDQPTWFRERGYGRGEDASYMPEGEARQIIEQCARDRAAGNEP